ncbi:hypothetical protein ACCO45_003998 [Purpureocillium lilacinum]|uniref:Uncharacterized protein n=1 Tax=Purpureocillium lilacinum TaxID=33203 RepID=A0ACC4E1H4_PURLI
MKHQGSLCAATTKLKNNKAPLRTKLGWHPSFFSPLSPARPSQLASPFRLHHASSLLRAHDAMTKPPRPPPSPICSPVSFQPPAPVRPTTPTEAHGPDRMARRGRRGHELEATNASQSQCQSTALARVGQCLPTATAGCGG